MSFVFAEPGYVTAAATDLANVASTISSANAMAAAPTTGVLAAGADEVSTALATMFRCTRAGLSGASVPKRRRFMSSLSSC